MSDITLGNKIEGEAHRDAIHVALIPMTASVDLKPSQHVDAMGGLTGDKVGIVDPFLKSKLKRGDRFYCMLYQNTVTGMRHHWSHPAFPDDASVEVMSEAKSRAKNYIEYFANQLGVTYSELMETANRYCLYGDYTYDNSETYKDYNFDKFWDNYTILTGCDPDYKGAPYTCSC